MADTTTTDTTTAPVTAPVRGQQGGQRDNNKRPRDDKRGGGFKDAPKEFQEELLWVDRVTRVTAGGRQLRFRASVVIGNGKGTVGFGIGKAGEVVIAIEKAIRDAKKNLISFAIVDGTIAYDLTASYKAANIFIHPASKGTGIISGGSARKIFAVSGIKDILAKQRGANNPITNARVTMKALSTLRKVAVRPIKTPVVAEETIKAVAPKVTEAKAVAKKEAPVVAKEVVKAVEVKAPAKKAVAKKAPAAKKPAAKPATKAVAKKPAAKPAKK